MELTTNQRIAAILEEKEISNTRFAKMLQMEPSTVIRQVGGKSALSGELISQMLVLPEFSDVSAEYIMRGIGPMYLERTDLEAEVSRLKEENMTLRMSCSDLMIELTQYRHGKK